jgi:hypothetical protein
MSCVGLLLAAGLLVGLVAGGLWLRRQIQIDSCLDAGGRWNYVSDECEWTFSP